MALVAEFASTSVSYGNQFVLRSISARLEHGSFTVCTGPSGSGKSTLGQVLAGSLPATAALAGAVTILQSPVALIDQEPSRTLSPFRRVADQVADVVEARGAPRSAAAALLARTGIADRAHAYPHQLSSGQIQRAAIARALAMSAKLIVADEPTASLDAGTEAGIVSLIDTLRRDTGLTVLWITHRAASVQNFATAFWTLDNGSLTVSSTIPAADPRPLHEPPPAPNSPELVWAKRAGKTYDQPALIEADLSLTAGRTCIVRGRSGSGKSTLARILAGVEAPDTGVVERNAEVQLVWPDPAAALNPRWRVADTIAEPLRIRGVATDERDRQAREWMKRLHLPEQMADRRNGELSGGQRRRVLIARALITNPGAVVFDEATSGLDPELRAQVLELLRNFQAESGAAFLWITHDDETLAELPGHRYRMEAGRLYPDA